MIRSGTPLLLLVWLCGSAQAEQVAYALVVGNNAPPAGDEYALLPTLRYADDDAVRYLQFFERLAAETHILTVPDEETQKRYPDVAAVARPPTLENLKLAINKMAARIEADRGAGRQTVVYLAYSGHGAIDENGEAFLTFLDGGLTREMLHSAVLEELRVDYLHLIVDACHASAVVGARGLFDRQVDARQVPVTEDDLLHIAKEPGLGRFPGVGMIVATTSDQEAHEWSRIQSGVFTHELLSGLGGPADVNGDGRIEYSEVHAFVSSANREVQDTRAVPRVIAWPPERNHNVALVVLDQLRDTVMLDGNPSRLGHFHIELDNGQRYLDANLGGLSRVRIALPSGRRAFLRTATHEADVGTERAGSLRLADLQLSPRQVTPRGSIDAALHASLFSSPYGVTYYKGFVDSRGIVGVKFTESPLTVTGALARPPSYRKPLAIGCLILASGSAIAAIVTGSLAIKAKYDFDNTTLQRPAHVANERYIRYGNAALATGIAAAAAGLVTWLLWPDGEPESAPVTVGVTPGGSGLVLGFTW